MSISHAADHRRPAIDLLRHWIQVPWTHRSLLYGFLEQDIKGRFAGSMGGLLWSVIIPLVNIFIYIFVFSVVMKIRIQPEETGTDEFAIYLLAGMLPWLAFSEALSRSTPALLEKAGLITKVHFPVHILPYVMVFSSFILNGLALLLFLIYLAFSGYLSQLWLFFPLLLILHVLFTLGLAAFAAALCVFLRDLQQLMTVILSLWFFLTPIIYPLSMVPEPYSNWLVWNPTFYFAELYRDLLLQSSVDMFTFSWVAAMSVGVWLAGGWFFMRIKHAFGDVL
jgi:lipopolysaccharide transport system permease protein